MAVLEYVTGTLESARRQADRVVTPDTRQRAYETVHAFAQQRPLLFSFFLAQILLALLPVTLFTSFVLGTVAVALVSALLFSLFWISLAALVLAAALSATFALAVAAWVWGVGAYLAVAFAYGLVVSGGQNQGQSQGQDQGQQKSQRGGSDQEVMMLRKKWEQLVQKNGGKEEAEVKDGEPYTNGGGAVGDVDGGRDMQEPNTVEVKVEEDHGL